MEVNVQKAGIRYRDSQVKRKSLLTFICLLLLTAQMSAQSFSTSNLNLSGSNVSQGTSLMFGPDGRLYVIQNGGLIDIFAIQRNGVDNYVVTASEELTLVKDIPNHNDDGTSNGGNTREATGITVAGTPTNPIIYATSSDARVGGPSGDQNLDTNSGVITRITWNGSTWDAVDIVRGLPRSEENHATNGLEFVTINGSDYLIVSQGGHANAGSPSDNFAWTTEYALSAAILSVNLTMLETMPIDNDGVRNYIYDLPTVDDPTRNNLGPIDPNAMGYTGIDVNDPFGGNDGLNQAKIVPGGPIQIFSPGYRNSYDLVVTQDGKVFVTDNGANGGWGGLPENEGLLDGSSNSLVTNNYLSGEPGSSSPTADGEQVDNKDHLTIVTDDIQNYVFGSFYGGHPTPIRANPSGAGLYTNPSINNTTGAIFRTQKYDPDGSTPGSTTNPNLGLPADWPPVQSSNAVEGDWRSPSGSNPDGPDDVNITTWGNNTNGIDEYTASNFGGAMQGDLIAGKGGSIWRVQLNANNTLNTLTQNFATNLGNNVLGITCNSDSDFFPGTIWIASYDNNIRVLEPQDFVICILPGETGYDENADNDGDGYTNKDEIESGSDICNGGDQPSDFDKAAGGTLVSDLNDTDDDNDGIPDSVDPLQLGDPTDSGSDAFDLPVINELLSDFSFKGYLGLGFTGLMNNGDANPNWLNWLDVVDAGPNPNDILGGAVGAMTIQMTSGTADGSANDQEKAFQYGVNVDQSTSAFLVEGRLFNFDDPLQLYGSSAPALGELGLFIGDGTQSNFIKFVITQNGLEAIQEIGDSPQSGTALSLTIPTGNRPSNDVVMRFAVNSVTGQVSLLYSFDGATPFQELGTITAQGAVLNAIQNTGSILTVGFIGSSYTPGVELEGSWDYLYVQGSQPTIQQQIPDLSVIIGATPTTFNLDNYFSDDGGNAGLTYSVENNSNPAIGASVTGNTLDITFPSTAETSAITVRATDGNNLFIEQIFNVEVLEEAVALFRVNSNGSNYTDGNSDVWEADNYFTGGGLYANTAQAIGNTTDDLLYQTERFGDFSYDLAVANGDYTIELHFAEVYFGLSGGGSAGGVGSRVFNVNIEGGAEELTNYDIFADVGPGNAVVKLFPVTVTDGILNIVFTTVTNNAKVSAIAILNQTGGGGNPITWDTTVSNQTNSAGEALDGSLVAVVQGGDGNIQYSATGLPPGVFIEPTNGNIYGTISPDANVASPYEVTVTADDSDADSTDQITFNFIWTVTTGTIGDLWTNQTDDEAYTARHECSFVQAGDKFYLFGGRENSTSLDVYNYQAKTWSTISNSAPQEFNHFQALEHKGLIWVIGAFKTNTFPNEVPADNVYAYNPVEDVWIKGPEIPTARKRGSAGLVVYNDKFYIIAGNNDGHDGGYGTWFDEFDPVTGVWTTLTDAPRARDHFHAAVIGDNLYVAGGRLSGGTGGVFQPLIAEVDVYNFTSGNWSTLPVTTDFRPRAAASVAVLQNELYLIGGEIENELDGTVINDAVNTTQAYNPSTGNWTTKVSLITERHGTQAIVSGDGIHVVAGSNSKGGGGKMKNMEFYGSDNPTGAVLTASQLVVSASESVPTGGGLNVPVSNTGGNVGIIITDAQLTGANAAAFTIVTDASFLLIGPGETTNIVVNHTGAAEGESASLTLTYDDGSTSVVSLISGAGVADVLFRINTGGALVTATDGPNPDWTEDQAVVTANGTANTGTPSTYINLVSPAADITFGVANFTGTNNTGYPDNVFATERYSNVANPDNMQWNFTVPNGDYTVNLIFAEVWTGAQTNGIRLFDVEIEGNLVLDDFDQTATYGWNTAGVETFNVTVADGNLDIDFLQGIENPNIKAIEILGGTISTTNSPPLVINPGIQQSIEGDVVGLQVIASDDDLDECGDITFSATGLPPTLNIDPTTGLITGTILQGTGTGTEGAFIEEDGIVIIEAESGNLVPNWSITNLDGETGILGGTNSLGQQKGGTIPYEINITTTGVYRLIWNSFYSGPTSADENDSWLRFANNNDVWFFGTDNSAGALGTEAQIITNLQGPQSEIVFPIGSSRITSGTTPNGSGSNGYFKTYLAGGQSEVYQWEAFTSDNDVHNIYVWFVNPGTYTMEISERSSGHAIDRIAMYKVDGPNYTGTDLDGFPESQQETGGFPGAADNSPYNVTVTAADACAPSLSSQVDFIWNVVDMPASGNPSALLEITPGGPLGASTYGGSSLQLTNNSTGNVQITGINIDISTGILPDNVFDPVGTGGDATASCLTANNGGAAVGFISPANPCVNPFSGPRNGGYDIMGMSFTDFDPTEKFDFTVDIDPNSIKDVPGAGGAGSVSGFELIGATITITFSDGSTLVSTIYEDGSLGGGQAVVAPNALATPSIAVVGIPVSPSCVETPTQTIEVSGTPGANVSLLVMDSRLYIQSGEPPFNVPDETYYANEAMAKALYTGVIGSGGTVQIPVTLLETVGATGTPNGGLNYIVAVVSNTPYAVDQQVSRTSNVLVLKVDPPCAGTTADINISATLQSRTNHSGDYSVKLYDVGSTTAVYDVTATADAAGTMTIDGTVNTIVPGTYQLAVKYPNSLQVLQTVTLEAGANAVTIGELLMGDANEDNTIGLEDFSILVSVFGLDLGETGYDARSDFNGDNSIGLEDFSVLVSNFNTSGEEPNMP